MLKRNEWWAVVHAHNGQPFVEFGQAAIFEYGRQARAYAEAKKRVFGPWNVRVMKVVIERAQA
jgi:hypothetical protein